MASANKQEALLQAPKETSASQNLIAKPVVKESPMELPKTDFSATLKDKAVSERY